MGNTTREELVVQLNQMLESMQYMVEHPRIQQKTWVVNGRRWIPLLRLIKAELESGRPQSSSDE